ncbi:MAG: hypothetical protein QOD05_930 [Microbacteriaceae bacterium]|jgi:hypothetical protein|nr:hypothetical protein [Microbacteriaceae bacterium]
MSIPDHVHADYHRLATRNPESLTEDEARSILYFRTEQSIEAGTSSDDIQSRVLRWVTSVRAVDDFLATHGRLPRENNRLPRAEVSSEERVLVEWLRYQRRPRTRETHCSYQRRRLEALPGFRWDPIAGSWSATLCAYEVFLTQSNRAPAVRSSDPFERSLAAWAAKQRFLRRRGRLDLTRESALAALSIWTWGAP